MNKAAANQAQEDVYCDRELDSDQKEPLLFEQHFILRLPSEQKALIEKMHKMVAAREVGTHKDGTDEPFFKFLDSRRAIFGSGDGREWNAKLVDLPCIIESQKTLDIGKHVFKAADISQVLLVENHLATKTAPPAPEGQPPDGTAADPSLFDAEDYVFPHGITPPMKDVRKRRFRKRVNKKVRVILFSSSVRAHKSQDEGNALTDD